MTQQQQRIAIAEACGWSNIHQAENGDGNTLMGWWSGPPRTSLVVPDYPSNLNAMHGAEAMLWTRNNWSACEYEELLKKMTTSWAWHATAAQRCEAFLRTLNLWTS